MVEIDYKMVTDVNRSYAVQGAEEKLDEIFQFLQEEDFEAIYDEVDTPEEHRDFGYGTVREFDFSNEDEARDCVDFMTGYNNFTEDVLLRVRNADDAPENLREDFEHAIKSFHEKHSFGVDDPNTCVLVSGTDRLTKYDHTLSGRIFTPPELQ